MKNNFIFIMIVFFILLFFNILNAKMAQKSSLNYYEDEERNKPVAVEWRKKGDHALAQGEPAKSISYYQQAIIHDPRYAQAYINLSRVYLETNEFDLCIEAAKKGLEAKPKKKSYAGLLYFNIGLSYLKKALHEEVEAEFCDSRILESFKKSLELYPENKNVYFQIGAYTSDCLKKPEDAIIYFKKGCNLGDDSACLQYQNFTGHLYGH